MTHLNQKERAIALLAGNGVVVVQAFLFISQFYFRSAPLPRADATAVIGLAMFSLAGIAGIGLLGCFFAYRALECAGSDNERQQDRCERSLSLGFIVIAANIATGIVVIMIAGSILMASSPSGTPDQG